MEAVAQPGPIVAVVDDDPTLVTMICRMLAVGGFRSVGFSNPTDAVTAMERGQPADLIVCDFNLTQGMTGHDLARRLRTARPELPVILVTEIPYLSHSTDVMATLIKPFRMNALLDAVRRCLDRS